MNAAQFVWECQLAICGLAAGIVITAALVKIWDWLDRRRAARAAEDIEPTELGPDWDRP